MNETERLAEGWSEIAQILNVHPRTIRRRKKELLDNHVVFLKLKVFNKPPAKMVYCTWPSVIKKYVLDKGWF